MITIPTTLILGAGASQPYGFPTGVELRSIILEKLIRKQDPQWIDFLKERNFNKTDVSRFAYQFMRSGQKSIDYFLASHSELIDIGKICIALAIIPFEEKHGLYEPAFKAQASWYGAILEKIATPYQISEPDKFTILTFNYDRSLDEYIYDAIQTTFANKLGKEGISINRIMEENIPIRHIHGQLGNLPWQGGHSRKYSRVLNSELLEIAWRNIRIPSERYENRPLDTIINYTLRQSERIYFLGFGYDNDNLEKLGINNLKDKTMKGTSYNLTNMERGEITSKWGIELPKENCEILSFLRNHAPLD